MAKVPRTITAACAQKQQLEPIGPARPTGEIAQENRYKTHVFYCRKWSAIHWDPNENDVESDFWNTFAEKNSTKTKSRRKARTFFHKFQTSAAVCSVADASEEEETIYIYISIKE